MDVRSLPALCFLGVLMTNQSNEVGETKGFQALGKILESIAVLQQNGKLKGAATFASQKAKPYLKKNLAQASCTEERRAMTLSYNLLDSFVDGVESGDVNLDDIRNLHQDIAKVVKTAKVDIAERTARKAKRVKLEEANENPSYDPGENAEEVYEKYESCHSKVLIDTKKPYTATRCPVVVITKGIPNMEKLKRSGLCDDFLFGYPIIKNQVLIGFHPDFLRDYISNYSKYEKQKKNNLTITVDLNVDWDVVSDFMSAQLKERFGRSYTMMGPAHKFGSLHWAWMMEDRDIRRLSGASGLSTFTVVNWSIPVKSELAKLKSVSGPNTRVIK